MSAPAAMILAFMMPAIMILTPITAAHATCDDPPPPVRDIIADRFYVDSASSVADKAIIARNRNALATLDHTLHAILAMTDLALAGDAEAAACAGRWMAIWAKGGAMLGAMSSRQAEVERKWRTAGLAVGYLKVRATIDPADRAAIDAWMDELADRVVADQGWPAKRNNHVYWAGFAAGAVGTATGTARHLEYARRAYDAGLSDIRPDGTLPMELARRQKALDYTNYALAPLVMLAELASLRGEDWYAHDDSAIHRLAARVLSGLRDPKAFARLAGEPSVEAPRGGGPGLAGVLSRAVSRSRRRRALRAVSLPLVGRRSDADREGVGEALSGKCVSRPALKQMVGFRMHPPAEPASPGPRRGRLDPRPF